MYAHGGKKELVEDHFERKLREKDEAIERNGFNTSRVDGQKKVTSESLAEISDKTWSCFNIHESLLNLKQVKATKKVTFNL